ncbi:DgyrCDS12807 [Dimorphilus gyrociliatus]|uniref:Protein HTATIP2 n=1 Tax=Dimorphilus gyrociliatus TaxID=2664684 RepID=A0A7I8W8T0_9ANNE|nr:DgyrCDS12807 [Dimorphilus gyrociliatus]
MADNQTGKRAFIIGFTGATGMELLNNLAKNNIFSKIVLIGRRKVDFDDEEIKSWEQRLVDFDNLSKHADDFKDLDVGFCSLGTTRAKAGKDGFYKIDHDYVIESAKLAKEGGCKEFHYVSSAGADKNSMMFYLKTKKQVEEDLAQIGFDRLSIYRPKMLLGKRKECRITDFLGKAVLKPVIAVSPTAISIPIEMVAKAMLINSQNDIKEPVEVIDNAMCYKIGKGDKDIP